MLLSFPFLSVTAHGLQERLVGCGEEDGGFVAGTIDMVVPSPVIFLYRQKTAIVNQESHILR